MGTIFELGGVATRVGGAIANSVECTEHKLHQPVVGSWLANYTFQSVGLKAW